MPYQISHDVPTNEYPQKYKEYKDPLTLLTLIREKCKELGVAPRIKGGIFEKISKELLKERDSENSIKEISLWNEWLYKDGQDTGIDLVVEHNDGTFAAVQCKFYEKNVSLNDVTNFTSKLQSGVGHIRFSKGILITSSDFSENVYEEVEQIRKTLPVDLITEEDFRQSNIDWEKLDVNKSDIPLRNKKELRPHQQEALERTKNYFLPNNDHDNQHINNNHHVEHVQHLEKTRGKIIMACGTGKTLTALRMIETLCPKEGKVCFFAPSIALVAQTFREFLKERKEDFIACILCSDRTVGKDIGKDDDDLSLAHLPSTPSTNPKAIVKAFEKAKKDKKRLIIFSTYQSSPVLSQAFKENHLQEEFGAFDLMICDEGHRTVGAHTPQEKEKSPFLYCHDDALIPAQKRLYMSATPKVWTSASKAKAKQNNTEMYSMDDPQIYGDVIFSLPFSKAIEQDLLSDYQVMIVALRSDQLGDLTEKVSVQITSQDKHDKLVDRDFVCKILGTYKGLARSDLYILNEENYGKNHQANGENSDEDIPLKPIEHYTPAQRAVLFCRNIKTSKALTKHFGTVIEAYHEEISKEVPNEHNEYREEREEREAEEIKNKFGLAIDHIDGGMNAKERLEKLKKLDQPQEGTCHILSNARCLSEGVDVPALDSVIFFDPKQSQNDIIQAIGRVLRKAPGKERGFIILPLVIDQHELAHLDEAVENTDFKGIWKVLCALRSEDDTLIDETQWKKKITIAISDPTEQQERDPKDQAQQDDFFRLWQSKMLKTLNDALFNAIPRQFGVESYWKTFGEKTAKITTTLIERIEHIFTQNPSVKDAYLQALKAAIHPNITETEAVELLASHIVTQPIFNEIFPEGENYPITKALNQALDVLKDHQLDNETKDLRPLYEEVEAQVRNARSEASKQKLIKSLYGTFFKKAFEKQTDRFGIVYTPIEAVHFILRMVRDLTQKHFGKTLNDKNVKIYDPFTGTGSFMTSLLNKDNGFIEDDYVKEKFEKDIFAQDITLLSYHIAGVNISSVAKERVPSLGIFPNLILGDSLNVLERAQNQQNPTLFERSDPRWAGFHEALDENKQKEEQLDREEINIIIGNPPYRGGASSENENNANLPHPVLEQQIKNTYGKDVKNPGRTTGDTLIQAIRMATNKIEKRGGIIGFILNGGFLDAKSADGFRLCIEREFSEIYVLNLRGNQRTSGETSRKEGGKIFDSGSRATVAVCFFVKNPPPSEINNSEINDGHKTAQKPSRAKIHYYAVEDYLSREAKLNILESFRTLAEIPFENITPNDKGDWIKQRNSDFETLIPFKKEKDAPRQENALFVINSLGLVTNRDAWVYNFSKDTLQNSMATCIATYRADCAAFDQKAFEEKTRGTPNAQKYKALTDQEITTDSTKISWTDGLKQKLIKQAEIDDVDPQKIRTALYRPFVKTHVYWDKTWNSRQSQLPHIFPEENSYNRAILTSPMESQKFSVLMTDTLPDCHTLPITNVFPLYHYNGEEGREDNISEKGLRVFQNALGAEGISKEDIFYYSYALFHHKTYTETYANDLAKEAPRLPILRDFQAFAALGKQLGDLHCRYEEQTPYDKTTIKEENYRVDKIKRSKDGAKIIYNAFMTLEDIPPQAYAYTINGKSAIDWFIERYQNTTDKDTLIPNDPNEFRGEYYIFKTLCQLITMSLISVELIEKINALPYDRVAESPA